MNKRPHKVCCTEQSACFLWQSQRSALWSRPGWSRNEEHNGDHAQQRRWWLSVCGSLQSDGLSSQQWLQDCRTLCSFSSICIALGGKLFLCSFPSVCVALGTVGGRLFLCSFLSVCVASGKGQRGGHSCVVYFPSLCIAMGGGGGLGYSYVVFPWSVLHGAEGVWGMVVLCVLFSISSRWYLLWLSVFRKYHMCSTMSQSWVPPKCLWNSSSIWLTMALSHPLKEDLLTFLLSTPLSSRHLVAWCPWLSFVSAANVSSSPTLYLFWDTSHLWWLLCLLVCLFISLYSSMSMSITLDITSSMSMTLDTTSTGVYEGGCHCGCQTLTHASLALFP